MEKTALVTKIIDTCSKETLDNLFGPILDLPEFSTKAEIISHCLNKELGAYGFQTYVSPDNTSILINDETMCQIMSFLNKEGF